VKQRTAVKRFPDQTPSVTPPMPSWSLFATSIVSEVERLYDDTSFLDAHETASALAGVRQAIAALQRLEARLGERQVERNDVTQDPSSPSAASR
jgi:hypothetical protein